MQPTSRLEYIMVILVAKTKINENPRLFNAPHRGTSNWQNCMTSVPLQNDVFLVRKSIWGWRTLNYKD